MRGHKGWVLLAVVLSVSCVLLVPGRAPAYVGPGPGLQLLPHFYSLLTWVALALGATLFWPVQALLSRLWGWWREARVISQGPYDDA